MLRADASWYFTASLVQTKQRDSPVTQAKTEDLAIDDDLEAPGSFDSRFEAQIERVLADDNPSGSAEAASSPNLPTADSPAPEGLYVCTDCGHLGRPVKITRGNWRTELLLWLALLLPGVLYSIWRRTARSQGCELCRGKRLIPATSPIGRKMVAELFL